MQSFFTKNYLLIASLSFAPALKLIALLAAISMALPVAGLRPLRAARFLIDMLANPGSTIESPLASNSVKESVTACSGNFQDSCRLKQNRVALLEA
jgi:hypothetical protein